jgi:hypothetical protein
MYMNNLKHINKNVKLWCMSLTYKDVIAELVYTLDNCLALAQKLDTAVSKTTYFQSSHIPLIVGDSSAGIP